MTTEIIVMNKQGVALATDSAVTIGGNKVYNSANKLFTLSKVHPVSIMIYNAAEFMGIPWDTIIKNYRTTLGIKCFDHLESYAEDFIHFLINNEQYINKYAEDKFVLNKFKAILDQLSKQMLDKIFQDLKEMPNEDILNAYFIKEIIDYCKGIDFKENVSDIESFYLAYKEQIEGYTRFKANFEVNSNLLEAVELLFKVIINSNVMPHYSGIVITGYGDKEIFPSLVAYHIEGSIQKKLLYDLQQKVHISSSDKPNCTEAIILPFAQREMADLFVEGIDSDLKSFYNLAISNLCEQIPNLTLQIIQGELANEGVNIDIEKYHEILNVHSRSFHSQIMNQIDNIIENNYVLPLTSSVDILPKEELAVLAETLVNLTSVKRRMTMSTETVGGPTDVAIITKGDGFIWIKRKLYFDPKLNYNYFNSLNYKGGIIGED